MNPIPRDVIILPEMTEGYPGRWLAMNVFARTCLGVGSEVLELMALPDAARAKGPSASYRCWEVEYFSNEDGLLADPTRYRRDPAQWKELTLDREAMLKKLRAHSILVDDRAAYLERFGPKRNLLDRQHFGNYHEQHGQHFMLVRREDPAAWWMKQKFTPDLTAVRRDNLYGAVQWNFMEQFARERAKSGMRIADLGCGTGVYSNLLALAGAEVIGLDPSEEYLAVARRNAATGTSFVKAAIGEPGGLRALDDASVDIVFMSDALLFYFCPLYPGQAADVRVLLADIRRILKPSGRFVSLEPHPVFYMAPWLGDPERPFTVVTESSRKRFGINPPLSWLFKSLHDAGFAVTDLKELEPAEYFSAVDPRGYHFAREFPVWQFVEAMAVPN